jgi:hypothetical protein
MTGAEIPPPPGNRIRVQDTGKLTVVRLETTVSMFRSVWYAPMAAASSLARLLVSDELLVAVPI